MIKIGRIVIGAVQTNCYFLYREEQEGERDVIVFDPADLGQYLFEQLKEKGFRVAGICLTHGHFDHIFGTRKLRELSGAKLYAYEQEEELLTSAARNCSDQVGRPYEVDADVYLRDEEEITIAGITMKVIATPGHTKGSCCYYVQEAGMLICGDTLFLESVGRADLPTGNESALIRSIRERLFPLPDETVCYPGHGDQTTIGHEKQYNPFCC